MIVLFLFLLKSIEVQDTSTSNNNSKESMKVFAVLFLLIGLVFGSGHVCLKEDYDHTHWPNALAGQTALGECFPGYSSVDFPARRCFAGGIYSKNPTNRCLTNYCPEETVDGIFFPRTKNRDTAQGECPLGTEGNPTRFCDIDGEWGPVEGECLGVAK